MQSLAVAVLFLVVALSTVVVHGYLPSVHPNDAKVVVDSAWLRTLAPLTDATETSTSHPQETFPSNAKSNTGSNLARKKKWGVDNAHPNEYWFDDRIHTLGNSGWGGALHAAVAPLSTKWIDVAAYKGVDIRQKLARQLARMVDTKAARVVDLCCGVGFSTRALRAALPDTASVVGVDTSPEMVAMAEFITNHVELVQPYFGRSSYRQRPVVSEAYRAMKRRGYALKRPFVPNPISKPRFALANAEDTQLPDRSYDLVTVMYAFHEAPMHGRDKILQEARRLLQPGGLLAVVDICTAYVPSPGMLMGEPYVQEYQANIQGQLASLPGFDPPDYTELVPHHLGMWTLRRSATA